MRIRGAKDSYNLILSKMNGKRLGIIPCSIIESMQKGVKTVSEFTFSVNKYYGENNEINPLYDELKTERFIYLDEDECYVIKNISEENEKKKTVTAYSREKKLFKNIAEFEDITLTLKTPYADIEGCFSLDELLYDATGWHVGYVSPKVLYKSKETILDNVTGEIIVELTKEEKLRYQESVSSNWYDFINDDISEQFECFPVFNSYDKTVDLYDDEELGNDPNLILSYDNYLKSMEKEDDTEDITTVLTLSGNDDLTISEVNPSGDTYVENFSYFIENEEMSTELINALNKYYQMVNVRAVTWNQLRTEKEEKTATLTQKKNRLLIVYAQMKSIEFTMKQTTDEKFNAQQQERLVKLNDEKVLLEKEVTELDENIRNIDASIENINKLCKKKYATDENGVLIFTESLLNELKDFIYQDTYSNDSITDGLTLMRIGKKQLKESCYPTKTWTIDSVNFVEKLIDNGFRQHWNGELGLGDMIVLKGETTIEVVYLINYTQNFKDKTIELQLSNKKDESTFSLSIGERLTQGKEAYEIAKKSRSTINRVNKNRVGLNYDKINKKIL